MTLLITFTLYGLHTLICVERVDDGQPEASSLPNLPLVKVNIISGQIRCEKHVRDVRSGRHDSVESVTLHCSPLLTQSDRVSS